jgi:hypothetical protein
MTAADEDDAAANNGHGHDCAADGDDAAANDGHDCTDAGADATAANANDNDSDHAGTDTDAASGRPATNGGCSGGADLGGAACRRRGADGNAGAPTLAVPDVNA